MKKMANDLAPKEYEIIRNFQTEKVQFVPQIVSTLRRDLVLWSNLPSEQPKAQFDSMSEEITGKYPIKMKV